MRLLTSLLLIVSCSAHSVPEIPHSGLDDLSVTTRINNQVVILYNPEYCMMAGPLVCNFYRAHEYAHVRLNHLQSTTAHYIAEAEADCWAAKHATENQVKAAYIHFYNRGLIGDPIHGSGFERAMRIKQCYLNGLNS